MGDFRGNPKGLTTGLEIMSENSINCRNCLTRAVSYKKAVELRYVCGKCAVDCVVDISRDRDRGLLFYVFFNGKDCCVGIVVLLLTNEPRAKLNIFSSVLMPMPLT